MRKITKKLVAATALGILCMAASAQATVLLDFGFTKEVGVLDWSPGTAISVGASSPEAIIGGVSIPLIYQAKLGNFLDGDGNTIAGTGLGSNYEITATMKFYEFVSLTGGPGTPANFFFDPSKPSSISIYKDPLKDSNNLAGTGFTNGSLVLAATVISDGFNSSFNATQTPRPNIPANIAFYNGTKGLNGYAFLDSSPNGNNWGNQLTVNGSGGTDVNAAITYYDQFWIKESIDMLTFSILSNTSNNLPFAQVDPSRLMFDGTVTTANLGSVNGQIPAWAGGLGGNDVMFQADANSSFEGTSVPEPSTFALTGLGLLLAARFMRRRRA